MSEVPNARTIIAAAEEALRRASAPMCYLHRTGQDAAFAVVITAEHLLKIEDLIPRERDEETSDLVMNHGHVEGDEDDG